MKTKIFKIGQKSKYWIKILVIALLLSTGCSLQKTAETIETTEQLPLIAPPILELDPEYTINKLNATKGGVLTYFSGTKITFPENALTDSAGNPIQGEVEVKYREFHDAIDILLAGIPMNYESAGETRYMETAGMFEILAFQNGKEVFIAPEKKVEVRMASYEADNNYSFFRLNESGKRGWEFIDLIEPEINTEKIELSKKIEEMKYELKFPFNSKYFVFDYNSIIDVFYKNNWKEIRENKQNKEIMRKAEEYGISWTDIYNRQDITFKGIDYKASMMLWKKKTGKKLPKWTQGAYSKIKYINGNMYLLSIERRKRDESKKQNYEVEIEAIMPLEVLFKYTPQNWKKDYGETIKMMNEVYEG